MVPIASGRIGTVLKSRDPGSFGAEDRRDVEQDGMPTKIRNTIWLAVLAIGVLLTGLHSLVAAPANDIFYYTVSGICLVAAISGLWFHRPLYSRPWHLLIAGIALLVAADVIWDFHSAIFGREVTNPSFADPLYLAGFGLVITAFVFWSRFVSFGVDREDSLDSGIFAVGLSVTVWIVFLEPRLGGTELSLGGQAISVAYPILDLFLLALLVRLALRLDASPRRALLLFAAGTVAFGISDVLYGWGELTQNYGAIEIIADAGWMLCYTFWAAAMFDPTIRVLEQRPAVTTRAGAQLSTQRAALLVGVTLLVPTLLIVEQFRQLSLDTLVIAAGSAALFVLVISRLRLIVGSLESAIEKRAELQRELEYAAFHDSLTGLANRSLLKASLDEILEQPGDASIAVLFLDLDNFKDVNDQLGHGGGDRLLVHVAEQLCACVRSGDMVGRIGGDEFLVLLRLQNESPRETGITVSNRILDALDVPVRIGGRAAAVGASIGIAWPTGPDLSIDSIFGAADRAMYEAKRAGKHRFSVAPEVVGAAGNIESIPGILVSPGPSSLSPNHSPFLQTTELSRSA